MIEADFQAALNALQMLKSGIEQLVINQAIEIAKLKAELATLKAPIATESTLNA